MTTLEKQIFKLINDKFVKTYISEIIRMETVNEQGLLALWQKVSGSNKAKRSTGPKKVSGYNLFLKDKRPGVKAEHPEWKTTDIVREIGRLWRELDVSVKADWKVKAKRANEAVAAEPVAEVVADCEECGECVDVKDLGDKSIEELRAICNDIGVSSKGQKKTLIKRITDWSEEDSDGEDSE